MGVVYRAEDPAIGRTVAIKTIRLGDLSDSSERDFMRERLLREARSAGILSHPGIVTIYDIFEEGDTAYVFMEFVNGDPLEKVVAQGKLLDKQRMFDYFRQTASALDYAHGKGIVHRDIKPANIMISLDGQAKITDFGVAKILSQQMTQTRSVLGTPYYMSPEQIQGGEIDGRSDQFALGVIAYELMTGERPYAADTLPTLLFKIVKEDPPSPERVNPSLPGDVGGVFRKVFAKTAAERYATCVEFIDTLATVVNKSPDWQPLPRGGAGDMQTVVSVKADRPPEAAPPPAPEPPASSGHDQTVVAVPNPAPSHDQTVVATPTPGPAPSHDQTVVAAKATPPPALPQIPHRREEIGDREDTRESNLMRNVLAAVLALVVIGGGIYAYLTYFQPASGSPASDSGAAIAEAQAPAGEAETALPPSAGAATPESVSGVNNGSVGGAPATPPAAATETIAAPPAPTPAAPPPAPAKVAPRKPVVPAQPTEHMVQVRSDPAGATVTADRDSALSCVTPCELELPTGRHVLNLTMAGHRLTPRIIQVPDITDISVNLDQLAGTLAISSEPRGATIYLNGQLRSEKTPAMIKLPAGTYQIRLTMAGKPDYDDKVEVRDQVITTVNIGW